MSGTAQRVAAVGLAAMLLACALPSRAQGLPEATKGSDDYADPRLARGFQGLTRPTGIAEVGVGWLTLPGASVCAQHNTGSTCKKGDTSFDLEAWEVYRTNSRFAFGAGLLLGLIPTTDAPRSEPPGITRNHSRSYLTLEGTIRHYPYVGEGLELWWGVSGGLAVVSDRFESDKNSDLALVGQRGVTIRSEGGSIGLVGGAVFWLANHWSLGTVFRYGNWFLPKTAAKDPLLDEASLTGRNTMFSLGISLAYRIPL
ncbi:MAG TPA: hypothetical protein VIK01_09795 [Polyangiaceae bacterium]